MKHLPNAAVLVGLAVYAAAFYAVPILLPGLLGEGGQPLRRFELLWQMLLLPDKWLFAAWFGSPPQFALADRLPVLLVAGTVLAWAAVLGRLMMRLCRVGGKRGTGPVCAEHPKGRCAANRTCPPFFALETVVFSLGAGLAVLSTWTLLLGLFGVLDRTWTFAVPAGLTLLAAIVVWYRNIKPRPSVAPSAGVAVELPPQHTGATVGRGFMTVDVLRARWLWLAVPFVLAIVLAAVLPPLDFDVREYHLQAPKEFFQQGRITFLPHNVYGNMPLGAEMLALLAMVISGDWWLGALAGKTVIAAFTPLCALALLAAGRRFFSTGAGVVAALAYISIPWVVGISTSGLIEGATACYLFLAVYALLLKTNRGAVLSGFFAGAAVATKYPAALFVLLPLGVWIVISSFPKRGSARSSAAKTPGKQCATAGLSSSACEKNVENTAGQASSGTQRFLPAAAKHLSLFLLAAAVSCGPWFAKNWAFTGNPTYPLLYEAFDGKTWNEEKNHRWNEVHRPRDFSPKALGRDLGSVVLTSKWLSPLVVPLAALALLGLFFKDRPLAASQSIILMLSAYAAFVIAAWWLCTHRIDRFWMPVLPVAALLAGAGAGACWNVERWWRGLLRGLLITGLAANFLLASSAIWYNAWFVPLN
ncbi:MAG: glycosyltransferase family 39 protein, partial [Pirellulales bacterium]|nr:glycosyltransferase family 39 protein [Pirellulales bacterium]